MADLRTGAPGHAAKGCCSFLPRRQVNLTSTAKTVVTTPDTIMTRVRSLTKRFVVLNLQKAGAAGVMAPGTGEIGPGPGIALGSPAAGGEPPMYRATTCSRGVPRRSGRLPDEPGLIISFRETTVSRLMHR